MRYCCTPIPQRKTPASALRSNTEAAGVPKWAIAVHHLGKPLEYISGMENLMMDIMSEDPMAGSLLDRVTEMSLSRAKLYAQADVDILFLGDDIRDAADHHDEQEMYTTWIKPRLKKIIGAD